MLSVKLNNDYLLIVQFIQRKCQCPKSLAAVLCSGPDPPYFNRKTIASAVDWTWIGIAIMFNALKTVPSLLEHLATNSFILE